MENNDINSKRIELEKMAQISGGLLTNQDRMNAEMKMREFQRKNMTMTEARDILGKDLNGELEKKQMEIWVQLFYMQHFLH